MPTFASISRPSAHMCMPLPDMSHEQNRPQEPHCPRQIWFCEAQIAVIVLLAPRHMNAETLGGYGHQWYATSGADSGGGLMPNLTARKPCRS